MSCEEIHDTISTLHPGSGKGGNSTLSGLFGIKETQVAPDSQESATSESSSGTEERDCPPSPDLLLENTIERRSAEDTARILKRLHSELSAVAGKASYHYDQYRFSVGRRNTIKREILQTKKRRENPTHENSDRLGEVEP